MLNSQFADDSTLSTSKIELALEVVEKDFCRPSGAKLNVVKTEVLCAHREAALITDW